MSHNLQVAIPQCYVWMTEGLPNRGQLFKRYVQGYMALYYPSYELDKILGMTAILKPLED
ncbi:hypothetical protein M3936_23260 [Sutcliffiella horikoshii]|uniref:hypothetical protein n=1 Tax=Sutcliffiella horikoshii TaxID=79883 RepID=UPI00203DB819|nr:hypothetical protein [Sutcliffiella horikoshii]MCM3620478.1 hypothetical protein [Sutcliffiella horikoshii]